MRTVPTMTSLTDLQAGAPSVAAFLLDKVRSTGLCFLATTRSDGWPRVSPIELFDLADRLYVGSMPDAVKARDLLRDPRCCISTPLADKDALEGEVKAFCRAREVTELTEYEAFRAAFLAERGFDMGEQGSGHLFELVIEQAAFQRLENEDEWRTTAWAPATGRRERMRKGAVGASVELPTDD